MEPSTASRIRNICRVCRKRRYRLVSGQIDENELTMLNLIIVIIGHYFEQIDLQDNNSPTPTQGAAHWKLIFSGIIKEIDFLEFWLPS